MPRSAMPILRNARRAIIDERKLTDYVLSPSHPHGRDKARLFRSILGYDRAACADLIEQIRSAI
jgi:filamentous hemagglutinin